MVPAPPGCITAAILEISFKCEYLLIKKTSFEFEDSDGSSQNLQVITRCPVDRAACAIIGTIMVGCGTS